jgi:uncharacterized protein
METTKYLLKLAEAGDPDAQFRIGHRLAFGRTHSPDYIEAIKWWKLASSKGHVRAPFFIATCYDFGNGVTKNLEEAIKWYILATRRDEGRGNESAEYNLGLIYRDDLKIYRRANYWFGKAAEHGDAEALTNIGYSYHEGEGVKRNYTTAVDFYRKAARKGDNKAMYNLGLSYQFGDGVIESKTIAKKWFQKAASSGHRKAKEKLKELTNPRNCLKTC